MPDHYAEDSTYWERTDTLTQYEDFVRDAILANMDPPAREEEQENAEPLPG